MLFVGAHSVFDGCKLLPKWFDLISCGSRCSFGSVECLLVNSGIVKSLVYAGVRCSALWRELACLAGWPPPMVDIEVHHALLSS